MDALEGRCSIQQQAGCQKSTKRRGAAVLLQRTELPHDSAAMRSSLSRKPVPERGRGSPASGFHLRFARARACSRARAHARARTAFTTDYCTYVHCLRWCTTEVTNENS